MNKVYTRINWENEPSDNTPLNETNLNKMDFALNEVDNRLIEQDTTKLSKVDASNDIINWTMNEETGVITVTRRNGEKIVFDLNIEKIPVSFSLSDDGILTMVTDDGTQFKANIGAMIPILTFNDSDEIAVSISGTGINKTYSFSIKDNSITENKLQPNFLADIKVQSASASLSASNAETSAIQAQSYATGGTGTRENEDTDNAMYYYEQAKETDIGQISLKVDEINSNLVDLQTDMDTKANKSDVLSLEEIQASTDLTDKIASASSVKDLRLKKVWSGNVYEQDSVITIPDFDISACYIIEYYDFSSVATSYKIVTGSAHILQISIIGLDVSNNVVYGRYRLDFKINPNSITIVNAYNTSQTTAITSVYKIL